ncbi:MAG: putative sugar nucleotidyl transferase [Balneolaceae bacterium]
MQLCFFSDNDASNLFPLTITRPVDELRIGILKINEKWLNLLNISKFSRITPDYLEGVFKPENIDSTQDCIWINSRYLPNKEIASSILELGGNNAITSQGEIVAIKLSGEKSEELYSSKSFDPGKLKFSSQEMECSSVKYLWDMLSLNANEIIADIELLSLNSLLEKGELDNCITVNEENIFISGKATVEPGCILNASAGPIFIGANAKLESGSIIKGPVAICEGATTKMAARIYDGTTIGPVCKVGGEVANSIFHSYSNKGHDGFVGNSLIGEWCNFGADTNTSNLKNNYSLVKLPHWETQEVYGSGVQFFGTVLADHSKTSINTMLNTGTLCGVSSNLFSSGFPPKYIPSFSWLSDSGVQVYDFEKAIIAMRAMMKRRDVELSQEYYEMMKFIFENRDA